MTNLLDNYTWWNSLKHGGLLIAPAKLAESFPATIPPLPAYQTDQLRRQLNRVRNGDLSQLGRLLDTVLEQLIGLEEAWWLKGPRVDSRWSCRAVTGETIKPRRVWQNGPHTLPLFTTDSMPGGAVRRLGIGQGRRAVSRVVEWLRKTDHKLALLTNGRQWRLIHAGADYDAWCEWDIDFWFLEGHPGPQVDALRILLGWGLNPQPLPATTPDDSQLAEAGAPYITEAPTADLLTVIQASRQGQAELSSELGERVRQAVELVIQESAPAIDTLLQTQPTIKPTDVYIAATRIVMRGVVILFAEARNLLPLDNPIYHYSYGLQGLREQLDQRAGGRPQERLARHYTAWPRLLALFRLVYDGSAHERLPVPRYGGGLFQPGDLTANDPVEQALTAFERLDICPSDAAVYRLLNLLTRSRVKVRQGRGTIWVEAPVDFSDLSSEYIGILYEGLLDFELRRATDDDPILFLNVGDQPALPLSRLEAMSDKALAALVDKLGKPAPPRQLAEDETDDEAADEADEATEEAEDAVDDDETEETEETMPADEETDDDQTHQTRQRAQAWAERAVIAGKLVRQTASQSDADYQQQVSQTGQRLVARIILPGHWFLVRWGGTRKGSGTFYTRPQLAGPTTRRTLEPLVYSPSTNHQPSTINQPQSSTTINQPSTINQPQSSTLNQKSSTVNRQSKIVTPPADILSLTICDPAMGSGSFLIAALRYLTDALYDSLHLYGHLEAHGDRTLCRLPDGQSTNSLTEETLPLPLDHDAFEPYLKARLKRHIVERCLYGVDLNPLAVELARLSLWVETMDRNLPFDFLDHKLKCGNALIGCWFDRFPEYPVMAWEREGGDKNHTRFVHHHHQVRKRGGKLKTQGDVWTQAIKTIRNEQIKPQMAQWVQQQAGQTHFDDLTGPSPHQIQRQSDSALQAIHRLPLQQPEQKAAHYRQALLENVDHQRLKRAFDIWCAIWFWPADQLEPAPKPTSFINEALSPATQAILDQLRHQYRFFHWELEFPDVFSPAKIDPQQTDGSYAGFSAIIGNPPWETLKPNSMEFFTNYDPLYRTYGKQEALRHQQALFQQNPAIEQAWLAYNAHFKAWSNFSRHAFAPFGDEADGGDTFSFSRSPKENDLLHTAWRHRRHRHRSYADNRHPFQYQGSADLNTYKQFLELAYTLLAPDGLLGLIVPSGIYSDKGTTTLRALFLGRGRWQILFGLINWNKIFKSVYYRFKFCIIIVQKGKQTETIQAAFSRYHLHEWENAGDYFISYPAKQIKRFSPHTLSFVETRTSQDLTILEKIYHQSVLLGDDSPHGWQIQYAREFDMTGDSKLFPPRPTWEAQGYRADEYGHWLKGAWQPFSGHLSPGLILSADRSQAISVDEVEEVALPLYEGRMVGQFDFSQKGWVSGKGRGAVWKEIDWSNKHIQPQFVMSSKTISKSDVITIPLKVAIMDIASSTNQRTMIATALKQWPCGHKVPRLSPEPYSREAVLNLVAIFNSFSFDYIVRNRFGGLSLTWSALEEMALSKQLLAQQKILVPLSASLSLPNSVYAQDWLELRSQLPADTPWQQLWAITPHERLRLRCIVDAVVAQLYGLDQTDFTWMFQNCDHPIATMRDRQFYRTLDPKGFWRVDKESDPELRHTVLAQVAFQELQRQGLDSFLAQNEGQGWQLPATLRLRDYGLGHDDRAGVGQPVAERLGPRFLPWQLNRSVSESWAECAHHAENLRRLLGGPGGSPPPTDAPRDLFGTPLQRDLWGNVIY